MPQLFPHAVGEIQGLYGPLQVLEGRIQQVWSLQQLQPGGWITTSGKKLRIRNPGRWNRGAGPDFLEAVIELDGVSLCGAIEIHLYREDWWRHGHHVDERYNSVILHVVLFAGGMQSGVRTAAGNVPDEWIMGPWLREDLEAVTGGDPGLFGELAPELKEWLESEELPMIRERLKTGADRRWLDKESMARCLIQQFGWEGGLHRFVLFYMGYPYNRKTFYAIAEAFPPEKWSEPEIIGDIRQRFAGSVRWNLGRPANRPVCRLNQYRDWCRTVPDWPDKLKGFPSELGERASAGCPEEDSSASVRKHLRFREWRRWLLGRVLGDCLNTCLADRLWIDVFLPALSAGDHLASPAGSLLWFHAPPGSFPTGYRKLLAGAGLCSGPGNPLNNGWLQGLYWVDDQMRIERVRSSLGSAPGPSRA